jgi:hypothetical protein
MKVIARKQNRQDIEAMVGFSSAQEIGEIVQELVRYGWSVFCSSPGDAVHKVSTADFMYQVHSQDEKEAWKSTA